MTIDSPNYLYIVPPDVISDPEYEKKLHHTVKEYNRMAVNKIIIKEKKENQLLTHVELEFDGTS